MVHQSVTTPSPETLCFLCWHLTFLPSFPFPAGNLLCHMKSRKTPLSFLKHRVYLLQSAHFTQLSFSACLLYPLLRQIAYMCICVYELAYIFVM